MLPQSRQRWCVHTGLGGGGWRLQGLVARRANPLRRTPYTTSPRYSCTAGKEMHACIYAICKASHVRHGRTQWRIHPCALLRSHVSQTYQSAQEIAWGAFSLPLLSLNKQKFPYAWFWDLLRPFQRNYPCLSVLFIGLRWLPRTFCTPMWEWRKTNQSARLALKELSES